MIRLANVNDLERIMEIVDETVKIMNDSGNFQWDSTYPREDRFQKDIDAEDLYVFEEDGRVLGFVCINSEESDEYMDAKWSLEGEALVVHRVAIAVDGRRKGIAGAFMKLAEDIAAEKGIGLIKTDTNIKNDPARGMFKRYGFNEIGEINLIGRFGKFVCLEKVL
jgi:ribosomal protein S18 acetylase RimI-like enzyme